MFLSNSIVPLIIAESILLLVVLIAIPVYAVWQARGHSMSLRGLALPQGSVRAMLALTVVGSLVVLIVFGGPVMGASENFNQAVSALTGIAGSILGFYFGSGGSGSSPRNGARPPNPNQM